MERKFPCSISNEKDLNIYEDYIKKCGCTGENGASEILPDKSCGYDVWIENGGNNRRGMMINASSSLSEYLKNHIGKLVRVESLIGGLLDRRTGTLLEVGSDYIVIKLFQSCSSMVCYAPSVRYVTIIHDGDLNGKAALF